MVKLAWSQHHTVCRVVPHDDGGLVGTLLKDPCMATHFVCVLHVNISVSEVFRLRQLAHCQEHRRLLTSVLNRFTTIWKKSAASSPVS